MLYLNNWLNKLPDNLLAEDKHELVQSPLLKVLSDTGPVDRRMVEIEELRANGDLPAGAPFRHDTSRG